MVELRGVRITGEVVEKGAADPVGFAALAFRRGVEVFERAQEAGDDVLVRGASQEAADPRVDLPLARRSAEKALIVSPDAVGLALPAGRESEGDALRRRAAIELVHPLRHFGIAGRA